MSIKIERNLSVKDGYILAEVVCYLPTNADNNDLHYALVRFDRNIWGIPLAPRCGVWDDGARYLFVQKSFPFNRNEIAGAIEWLDHQSSQAVQVLHQVINEYKELAAAVNQTRLEPIIINLDI